MTDIIVPVIILGIILFQLYFFFMNFRRMMEFRNIFKEESSWSINKNIQTGFVSGIYGKGNKVFMSIVDSINKYLGNNSGSVIDFQLLKDAVDRHSDSVEEDINTQTPVPLYCGLAGTMAGVIFGLFPLIKSGALIYLLSGNIPEGMTKATMDIVAANGINELLTGVAWAMIASICGIFLTTLNSLLFKRHKLKEESGKNSFLAWMQSSLLPELPSDTSDALNKLVNNLNRFNNEFANNTEEFRKALMNVNTVYKTQDHIIQNVREMDVMKMAKANVQVLAQLQSCTSQIEKFSEYLTCINEYTVIVKSFTDKFDSESERLHVLEEIKNFFMRHKGEIAKQTADSDDALKTALASLQETSQSSVSEFKKNLVDQSESLKKILNEEKQTFEEFSQEIKAQFSDQLQQIPMLEKNLKEISEIPASIDKLIVKMEQSNMALASNVSKTMNATVRAISLKQPEIEVESSPYKPIPSWMKWTIIGGVLLMTLASIVNTTFNIITSLKVEGKQVDVYEQPKHLSPIKPSNNKTVTDSVYTDTLSVDTIKED